MIKTTLKENQLLWLHWIKLNQICSWIESNLRCFHWITHLQQLQKKEPGSVPEAGQMMERRTVEVVICNFNVVSELWWTVRRDWGWVKRQDRTKTLMTQSLMSKNWDGNNDKTGWPVLSLFPLNLYKTQYSQSTLTFEFVSLSTSSSALFCYCLTQTWINS